MDAVVDMLHRSQGATLVELMALTGWQRHSVRGVLAGAVRKRLGAPIRAEVVDGERRYSFPEVGS